MIAAYDGTLQLARLQVKALGAEHPVAKQSIATNWTSLVHFIRSSTPTQGEVSKFIEYLTLKGRPSFISAEQTASLIEAASSAQLAAIDHVSPEEHGQQKEQTHMYSYRYYSEAVWARLLDKTVALPKKYRTMSKEWLSWGLIFPSAPTLRIGLSTLLVAMDMDTRGEQAHGLFRDFRAEFHLVRQSQTTLRQITSATILKQFPCDVSAFVLVNPNVFDADHPPVACKVPEDDIRGTNNPSIIPCRISNQYVVTRTKIARKRSWDGDEHAPSPMTDPATSEGALLGLLKMALGSTTTPRAESPRPSAPSQPIVDQTENVEGRQRRFDIEGIASQPIVDHGGFAEDALHAGRAASGDPATAPVDHAADNSALHDLVSSHLALKAAKEVKRRLTAKTALPSKPRAGCVIDSSDEDDLPLETSSAVAITPSTHAMRARRKRPAPKTKESTVEPRKTKESTVDRAATLPGLSAAIKYPPIGNKPTRWQGGSILHDARRWCFRAFRRVGDKHAKWCRYYKHGDSAAWANACQAILEDPRARDSAYL